MTPLLRIENEDMQVSLCQIEIYAKANNREKVGLSKKIEGISAIKTIERQHTQVRSSRGLIRISVEGSVMELEQRDELIIFTFFQLAKGSAYFCKLNQQSRFRETFKHISVRGLGRNSLCLLDHNNVFNRQNYLTKLFIININSIFLQLI